MIAIYLLPISLELLAGVVVRHPISVFCGNPPFYSLCLGRSTGAGWLLTTGGYWCSQIKNSEYLSALQQI